MKKENIVFYAADQMRADTLHHLGNKASYTPNLDQLASEGVSFENAFCQNPVCVPSRCSFLTGLYPHTTGHRTMHFLQTEDEPNILKTMKDAGYEVIWCGRNDVVPGGKDITPYCDEYFSGIDFTKMAVMMKALGEKKGVNTEVDGYYSHYIGEVTEEFSMADDEIVKYAMDYLDRKREKGNDKPFFLYITLMYPHPPYGCKKPFYGKTDRQALEARRPDLSVTQGKPSMLHGIHDKQNLQHWTEDRWNELRATYLDMVYKFDDLFGQFHNKLKETAFEENTSIFVFSDHGDYTGDYGIVEKVQNCFDDPICNVPLIVKPSKNIPCEKRISKALVELVDLSATISDITGVELNYTQFGKSLLNTLAGDEHHRDEVHCEGGRIHGEVHCMERGHEKTSEYWPRLDTQSSEGPEHTKAIMFRNHDFKYVKRLYEDDELYDLNNDPQELYNVIHKDKYKDTILEFKEKALNFMIETADYVPNRKDRRY